MSVTGELRMTDLRQKRWDAITAALEEQDHPITIRAISAATGLDQTTVYQELAHMEREEMVTKHSYDMPMGLKRSRYVYELVNDE